MPAPEKSLLLRIFIGDDDTYAGADRAEEPLYEAIAAKARQRGMNGLTASRGIVGFGPASLREQVLLRRSEDRPVVIEMVDTEAKISAFLPVLERMIGSGLVVVEEVKAVRYGPSGTRKA
jgi:PII-like signaling protein